MSKKINKNGQGIIEVIAAIYIFVIGLLSIVNLSVFNIQTERYNNEILVASNLAREGIEQVRSIRDSNWLSSDPNISWDNGLVFSSAPGQNAYMDAGGVSENSFLIRNKYFSVSANFGFDSMPVGMSWENCISASHQYVGCGNCTSACKLGLVRATSKSDPTDQFYDYILDQPSSSVIPTNFYKMIFINEICLDNANNEVVLDTPDSHCSNNANWTKIGIEVKSRIGWNNNGRMKIIDIEEKMYNWK